MRPSRYAFVRERATCLAGDMEKDFQQAMREMETDGPSYWCQIEFLDNILGMSRFVFPKVRGGHINCGKRIP